MRTYSLPQLLLGLLLVAFALAFFIVAARGHDFHHIQHNDWLRSLSNQDGVNCCDMADGTRLEDPDWDFDLKGYYRVRIDGQWYVVPPRAVILERNRIGFAVVWRYNDANGVHIRCFLPGGGV